MKILKRSAQRDFLFLVAAASAAVAMQLRTHDMPVDVASKAQLVTCDTPRTGLLPAACEPASDRERPVERHAVPRTRPRTDMWV